MLSFSELEFKWSVHVIDALNHLHGYPYLISLLFTMIYFFHDSEKCEKLAMLPQIWLYSYILKYVLQCTNETTYIGPL